MNVSRMVEGRQVLEIIFVIFRETGSSIVTEQYLKKLSVTLTIWKDFLNQPSRLVFLKFFLLIFAKAPWEPSAVVEG